MPGYFRIFAAATLMLLSGCAVAASTAMGDPWGIFQSRDINFAEKNYAAADFLVDRMKNYVYPESTIKAMPLLDVGEPRLVTRLGKEIPEQIGERLIQLGYKVDVSAVNTNLAASFAPTPTPVATRPDFILAGSYREKNTTVEISLSVKEARTGMERASFNYTLPLVGEVRKHVEQKPASYQIPTPSSGNMNN